MHRLAVNALTIIAFADALTFVDIRDMTVSCMTFNVYNPRLSDGVTPGNSLYVPNEAKKKCSRVAQDLNALIGASELEEWFRITCFKYAHSRSMSPRSYQLLRVAGDPNPIQGQYERDGSLDLFYNASTYTAAMPSCKRIANRLNGMLFGSPTSSASLRCAGEFGPDAGAVLYAPLPPATNNNILDSKAGCAYAARELVKRVSTVDLPQHSVNNGIFAVMFILIAVIFGFATASCTLDSRTRNKPRNRQQYQQLQQGPIGMQDAGQQQRDQQEPVYEDDANDDAALVEF